MTIAGSINSINTLGASMMDWLLGLHRVSWSDARSELGWRFALPAWAWTLIVLAALAVAWWSYSRLIGRRAGRVGLAGLRAMLVMFIAALLAGPMLVVPQEQVEPDWLLVLLDRSASLQIKDVQTAGTQPNSDETISRDQALRRALAQQSDVFTADKLGHDRRLVWLGFHGGTFEMNAPDGAADNLPSPDGQTTALRTAIEQALQRAAGRPISGIVLFTDGRSPEPTGIDLVRNLQQQAVSVFPVPLGSKKMPLDLAISRVEAPDKAFINDIVPVRVWIERYPSDASVDPAQVRVRLIDTTTGRPLAQQTLSAAGGFDQPVRLTTQSAVAGPVTWRVELVYDPPPNDPQAAPELITDNNQEPVSLELVDRPIRVLYVEGYPRWEYRYLKNMLIREKSIRSSMMLISSDRSFAQEGDLPITRLPETAEEMDPYDVIIIGDVPSDYFSTAQINLFRDHVAARGAGLLWIGGERSTPRTYDATGLVDLLPMREPAVVDRLDPTLGPVHMAPSPLAEELNVLHMRSDVGNAGNAGNVGIGDNGSNVATVANAGTTPWPDELAPLTWVQDVGRLKPTAEVLATSRPDDGRTVPLVMRMRYGAGQSLYVATDETWRWRFGRGNLYFQQFWVQLVQMLGRARIQQQDARVWLTVSHRRVKLDQAVVVDLHIKDELILKRNLPRISVGVFRAADLDGDAALAPGGTGARPLDQIELLPKRDGADTGDDSTTGPGAAAARQYQTIWRPSVAGRLVLRVIEPALADLNVTRPIEVVRPDDELREPATDHPRLDTLAQKTGGKVIPLDHLDELVSLVPNRARRTPNDIREPLWDSPLALVIVVVLLTLEWVGRKIIRLV